MDSLISETNARIQDIINNLKTIKEEYDTKLEQNTKRIDEELKKVKRYKEDFFEAKSKIAKMSDDIEGFQKDYQNLVDRFKDDELANILIAANKEISAKIEERKLVILKDKKAMNELVNQAEIAKKKLVKLNAEKKALEICLDKINDAYTYYSTSLGGIIEFADAHQDKLNIDTFSTADNEIKEAVYEEDVSDSDETDNETSSENIIINEEVKEENTLVSDDNDNIEVEITDEDIEEVPIDLENEPITSADKEESTDTPIEETPIVEEVNDDKEISEANLEDAEDYINDEEKPKDANDVNFEEEFELENVVNFDDSLDDDTQKED